MRILVVSDVHANLAALDAVIKDAGAFDRVWCLGDMVGYGPDPNECIDRLRSFDSLCLAGNHDLAVVGKVTLVDFNPDAKEAVAWSRFRISATNREWLETLPTMCVAPEFDITLVHGSPVDPIWEYIFTPPVARASFESINTRHCFYGHTHVPLVFRKPEFESGISEERLRVNVSVSLKLDRLLINPGSVGQPRDDDPRAAYAIFDTDAMALTHRRVQYDVTATQTKMKDTKFPGRLIRRLRFGQ
jgi:diadenosine tetraphosphatase ApaH/serine/threonine PP2A family protein phosphatase